ncbi:phage holin family protein [Streptomyces sp. PKU-EA00015]|uniref:phage holin family protein n=1 Tax=Streptomyces sp. PKU-EA00015 TaxID=2748326 RepID=UPI0015A39251|nr:phage holin family protein [Streptomyces sp. PKU-EA00015]NWF25481.1 phage holin family protein [Streptomyces sp. PKU-EA00015]
MSQTYRTRAEEPIGALVSDASQQISQLVRAEMRLAQAEMTQKGKRLGKAGRLFGGAGLVAVLGLQALVAAAIIALAFVLPWWASALIVAAVLFLVAAVLAAAGRKNIKQATPPAPRQTIDSMRADMQEIKGRAHR